MSGLPQPVAMAIVRASCATSMAVFFAMVFPLMFLVLFGGVFDDQGTAQDHDRSRSATSPCSTRLSPEARGRPSTRPSTVTHSRRPRRPRSSRCARATPTSRSRMRGDTLVAHYTQTDQVKAAIDAGHAPRLRRRRQPWPRPGSRRRYTLATERVEDESLKTIQFVTPGLLGWAVAMSATFGAAATLVRLAQTQAAAAAAAVARSDRVGRRRPGRW